jgi:hypothetical protein
VHDPVPEADEEVRGTAQALQQLVSLQFMKEVGRRLLDRPVEGDPHAGVAEAVGVDDEDGLLQVLVGDCLPQQPRPGGDPSGRGSGTDRQVEELLHLPGEVAETVVLVVDHAEADGFAPLNASIRALDLETEEVIAPFRCVSGVTPQCRLQPWRLERR